MDTPNAPKMKIRRLKKEVIDFATVVPIKEKTKEELKLEKYEKKMMKKLKFFKDYKNV